MSVDTLRRWDDAGVFKHTIRTAGQQRRFSVEELERVRDDDALPSSDLPTDVNVAEPREADPPRNRAVQPWEAREAEANADVAVTRARIERRETVRRYREAESARGVRAQAEAESRIAEARERQAASARLAREQHDLDHRLSRLRMGYGFESAAVKAEIEKFLADHARLGVSLSWLEASVTAIRERHAEQRRERTKREAAEREKQERAAQIESDEEWRREWKTLTDSQRRASLIAHGSRIAERDTTEPEWDEDCAGEARVEVKAELEALVTAEWTEREVEELVQEVLEEWET